MIIELSRIAIVRQGMAQESIGQGDYMYKAPNWEEEREKLLRRLNRFVVFS